jgi:hypothetical protein
MEPRLAWCSQSSWFSLSSADACVTTFGKEFLFIFYLRIGGLNFTSPSVFLCSTGTATIWHITGHLAEEKENMAY